MTGTDALGRKKKAPCTHGTQHSTSASGHHHSLRAPSLFQEDAGSQVGSAQHALLAGTSLLLQLKLAPTEPLLPSPMSLVQRVLPLQALPKLSLRKKIKPPTMHRTCLAAPTPSHAQSKPARALPSDPAERPLLWLSTPTATHPEHPRLGKWGGEGFVHSLVVLVAKLIKESHSS